MGGMARQGEPFMVPEAADKKLKDAPPPSCVPAPAPCRRTPFTPYRGTPAAAAAAAAGHAEPAGPGPTPGGGPEGEGDDLLSPPMPEELPTAFK